ncbi:MAG: cyanophycinase [Bacteroidetes bacterium]|nr:MAG: cyanophycinase [Bacteroidota bacterium]
MKNHILYYILFFSLNIFAQGKLFIIGGGKRPTPMLERLISESGVDKSGYIYILPYASEEQDSSIFYAKKQFDKMGLMNVFGAIVAKNQMVPPSFLDSISNAKCIYIPGGDQVKFMDIVKSTRIDIAIKKCFKNGGLIAGTSAGAAVMSQKMITGVELKYPSTTENTENKGFETIEANNIEISEGLGFLQNSIIDQHFIKRKRQNRLIAVAIENPNFLCVGIDEATAILVKNNIAEVIGDSQVLTLLNTQKINKITPKLSAKNLQLSLYQSKEKFKIK